ncbi:hypothetical protein O6H91_04G028900 [Diphasiastrum complanatum]|uniref:Uncharacterized protein n=1 Tax=Diphasiastrum complanatum TaxID=34168 RepID=A0ACC2DVP6_DIPCM|nr:hypothetical protein O6H91_04G028900 [Diphasiastrum complanatum]
MPQAGPSLFSNLQPSSLAHTNPLSSELSKCFNWATVFNNNSFPKNSTFFVVTFRSVRSTNADDELLYAADAAAQEEARNSGGLLHYWYGKLNSRRECLAMCIWESRESATRAIHKPAHAAAMRLSSQMYHSYSVDLHWLRVGADGNPIFEPSMPTPNT